MTQFGPVTGDVIGPVQFSGGPVSFAQGAAGAGLIMKRDTTIWYVDSGQSASGNGKTPKTAFITLQEAVDAAGDYDTILIMPNSIETIAAIGIAITQDGLRIFGANATEAKQACALKIAAGTASMFQVTGNRFEIANIYLSQRTAYPCIEIGSASVAAVYETHIHNVFFDGQTATYAVRGYAGTVDTVCLVVEDCYFQGFATAAISSNGTRDTYRRNTIIVGADKIGISIEKTGGNRNYGVYVDNYLIGVSGSSTTGIKLAGSLTAGTTIIAKNMLAGTWNTTITQSNTGIGVENYYPAANGGTLIDTDSG